MEQTVVNSNLFTDMYGKTNYIPDKGWDEFTFEIW